MKEKKRFGWHEARPGCNAEGNVVSILDMMQAYLKLIVFTADEFHDHYIQLKSLQWLCCLQMALCKKHFNDGWEAGATTLSKSSREDKTD